jgi:hypothetical protein
MREAMRLTAGQDNGYIEHLFVSTATTTYTLDVFIKRHSTMGSDVSGRIIMWDNTGGAEVASTVFDATTEWQRVTLQATTNVGQISTGFRIEIDTRPESLSLLRATAVQGGLTVPIYTRGGVATVSPTNFAVAGIDGQYIRGAAGEIEAVAVRDLSGPGLDGYLCDARNGNANGDRRDMHAESGNFLRVTPYNTAGVSQGNVDSAVAAWNVEQTCIFRWNANQAIAGGNRVQNSLNAVIVGGIGANWANGNLAETVNIGQDGAAVPATQLDGSIATLKIWDIPRP